MGGDTGYRIVKNGVTASIADIHQYDVATYDKTTKTLQVSDLRLTGVYENVSPALPPPQRHGAGRDSPGPPSAYEDLARFQNRRHRYSLLLTADGQVVGAVSSPARRNPPPSAWSRWTANTPSSRR